MVDEFKSTWLQLHRHIFSKFALYIMIGLMLGVITNRTYEWLFPRPAITFESDTPAVADFGDYFGIVVDRTRTRLCQVQSTQILFRSLNYEGAPTDVVLPLNEMGMFWPVLGNSKFIRLIKKPTGLPKGVWMTQAITTDECGFWNFVMGGHWRETRPIPISLNK
jgi:hypothetical protein